MNRRAAVCAGLRAAAGLWLSPALLSPQAAVAQADGVVSEYQVKAAYLYKFLDFVEWPASAFEGPNSPFVIGVVGADAMSEELDALIARRRVESRPVIARTLRQGESLAGLHVLFVGRAGAARATGLLSAAARHPLLVVSETDEAFAAGSVINFVEVDKRVRFDVALRRAEARELKISSRLLGVARKVEGP